MSIKPGRKKMAIPVPKTIIVITIIASVIGLLTSGFRNNDAKAGIGNKEKPDSVGSVSAFMKVYEVLMSPRCMNCHPAGDIPLQGDDSHLHTMSPKRGKDGKGLYAMKCMNCHQPTKTPGLYTPPANPKWALPPADMKMVFQGRSPRELALQIMDPKRNGHKNKAQLLTHAKDDLVKVAWNMGEGRKPPPITYNEFVAAWNDWINKGGIAPEN
jgi:hypothetical protein